MITVTAFVPYLALSLVVGMLIGRAIGRWAR
jgi:prepilin signal peptidase PulO-like enzyme (type II secretory pathway)